MKSIKSILIIAIGMIAILNVSCSNESEQKKEIQLISQKDGDMELIDSSDQKFTIMDEYSKYVIENYVVVNEQGESKWTDPSLEDLDFYFEIKYPNTENRPRAICNHQSTKSKKIYYVTVVADNGDYYGVMVDFNYSPPKPTIYSFGSYNPCGLLGTL